MLVKWQSLLSRRNLDFAPVEMPRQNSPFWCRSHDNVQRKVPLHVKVSTVVTIYREEFG